MAGNHGPQITLVVISPLQGECAEFDSLADYMFKTGDRVQMRESLKKAFRANKSAAHVREFGKCVGIVEDPVDYGTQKGPELNVRWQPSGLRYGYHPKWLKKARSDSPTGRRR